MIVSIDKITGKKVYFESILEAQKITGQKSVGAIYACLKGERKSAGGFDWEYLDESKNIPKRAAQKIAKKVFKRREKTRKILNEKKTLYKKTFPKKTLKSINLVTKEETIYSSAGKAAAELQINKSGICQCARGEIPHFHGYLWEYIILQTN